MITTAIQRPPDFEIRPWRLFSSALVFVCISTIAGSLGHLWWFFGLASHFRLQYFVFLLVSVPALVLGKKHREATLAGIFALFNFFQIVPLYFGAPSPYAGTQTFRALLINVRVSNRGYEKFRELVRVVDPDFMVVEEVNEEWMNQLQELQTDYPFSRSAPGEGIYGIATYGIALLSRIPFGHAEIRYLAKADDIPSVVAWFDTDGQPLTVIGVHLPSPFSRVCVKPDARFPFDLTRPFHCRAPQVAGLIEYVAAQEGPVMVLGDLNTTLWSPDFEDLLHKTGLRDSRKGYGLQPTWPTLFPPLWVPIDYVLVSPGVVVYNHRVGPSIGSDHYPVIVDFSVGSR